MTGNLDGWMTLLGCVLASHGMLEQCRVADARDSWVACAALYGDNRIDGSIKICALRLKISF